MRRSSAPCGVPFESAGFDVSIASDGMMAMETFRATMPRLVILDLRCQASPGQDLVSRNQARKFQRSNSRAERASDVLDKYCCWN